MQKARSTSAMCGGCTPGTRRLIGGTATSGNPSSSPQSQWMMEETGTM